jgi:hypothetical protein
MKAEQNVHPQEQSTRKTTVRFNEVFNPIRSLRSP